MAMQTAGRNAVDANVSNRRDFQHGNVSGQTYTASGDVSTGQLPAEYRKMLAEAVGAVYVVFSYRTPIAWWSGDGGWTMPNVRYSVTTSNHQNLVMLAANINREDRV